MRQWPSTSSRLALKRSTIEVESVTAVGIEAATMSVLCLIAFSRAFSFSLKAKFDLIDSKIASRAPLLFHRGCISVLILEGFAESTHCIGLNLILTVALAR